MPSGTPSSTDVHLLFSCVPAWGHAKPFCILAAQLVQENKNVIVTLLLTPSLLQQAKATISTELCGCIDNDETIRRRLRILSTFKSDSSNLFSLLDPLIRSYETIYRDLWNSRPITCSMTAQIFDAVCKPDVVILDFFAHQQMLATRAVSGRAIPIVAWVTGHIAHISHIFGPTRLGGSDVGFTARIEEEMKRTGLAATEVGDIVYKRTDGTIVNVPGAPAMYDWEFFPQLLPFNAPQWVEIVIAAEAGLKECDAIFSTSAHAFEEESLAAFKSWFSTQQKEVHVIGPFLSSKKTVDESLYAAARDFLLHAQENYDENSVLLISFGTIFWPTVHGYIEEVIEALVEKKFPFIITHASPFAKISENLVQKVQATGIGLISKWVPQQYILDHPATGWFMTHGGQNSVLEALGSGIPMICWPFEADQPIAAAHMSENLNVAFELVEVRTGEHGMKPLLRRNGRKAKGMRAAVGAEIREVIDACRGLRGAELRRNSEALKAKLAKAWGDEGAGRKELRAFLMKHGHEISCRPLQNGDICKTCLQNLLR
uniref:Glycosyltransferase family 1 protein n=1 Tax=Psilocybe cubensis TaxID=181762 RepID=A0A8H7XNL3_PSICU